MSDYVFEAADESGTEQFAAALAAVVPVGTTIGLCGTLGAGKTRLVQAIAAAHGVRREDVVSPTFVLWQQYRGRVVVNHLDAYRVRDEDEFRELGIEELFESDAITIIEWADRVADVLPDEYLRIDIEVTGTTGRRFSVQVVGSKYEPVISALARGASRR